MSCAGCVRVFMIVFNFLFTLIGFALLTGGLYFFFTETNISGSKTGALSNLAYFLLGVAGIGCITLLLGILGCCGAFHYSRCILSFYFVLLLILFASEIALGVLALQDRDSVKKYIDKALESAYLEGADSDSRILTFIETQFDCCGYKSMHSRCTLSNAAKLITQLGVKKPCGELLDSITNNAIVLSACLIGLALVQLLGLIFASILCCAAKDRVEYTQYHSVGVYQ